MAPDKPIKQTLANKGFSKSGYPTLPIPNGFRIQSREGSGFESPLSHLLCFQGFTTGTTPMGVG